MNPISGASNHRRRRTASAVLLLVAALGALPLAACTREDGAADGWFAPTLSVPSLTDAEYDAAAAWIVARLRGRDAAVPDILRSDAHPRSMFLSVATNTSRAKVVRAHGDSLRAAADAAVARTIAAAGTAPALIKIDFVDEVRMFAEGEMPEITELDPTLWGMAWDASHRVALLPEELVVRNLVTPDRKFFPPKVREQFDLPGFDPMAVRVRFTTKAFFDDGQALRPLFRGHRIHRDITPEALRASIQSAVAYLLRSVDPQGQFAYSYQARTDSVADSYNIVRHAGTVVALSEASRFLGDAAILPIASRALDHAERQVRTAPGKGSDVLCLVEDSEIKLGGNALAVLACLEYDRAAGTASKRDLARGLGRYIATLAQENGDFAPHKMKFPTGEAVKFESDFYAGEAVLALMRLHGADPNGGWLPLAEKGADFLIAQDAEIPVQDLRHDHWLLYALEEVDRASPAQRWYDHAMRIADAITTSQRFTDRPPDWSGSWRDPPRSTPVATRAEGLCAAWAMAKRRGDTTRLEAIQTALEAAARFQLSTQIFPETAMYLPDPEYATGAFRESLSEFEVRIDYIQHNVSALIGLHRILTSGG